MTVKDKEFLKRIVREHPDKSYFFYQKIILKNIPNVTVNHFIYLGYLIGVKEKRFYIHLN